MSIISLKLISRKICPDYACDVKVVGVAVAGVTPEESITYLIYNLQPLSVILNCVENILY